MPAGSNDFWPLFPRAHDYSVARMAQTYDVIVVGLGAMGSASLYHLARRGVKALGLDQFSPPHDLGSSHGQTRIIREAYFEDPIYVPMIQRAIQLWRELEQESGHQLYLQTGGLMLGAPESIIFSGSQRSAREHNLPFETLDSGEIRRRFPALNPEPHMIGLLEPRAGILYPEKCIATHLELARRHGATLRLNETVESWQPGATSASVKTPQGTYEAANLVLCSGAWLPELLPDLDLHLETERQVLFWFEALSNPEYFSPERCPVHLWEYEPGLMFYGFPDLGTGIKTAIHHQGVRCERALLDRNLCPEDEARMRALVARFLPEANGPLRSATVCVYTNTRDEHFLLDRHPAHANVIVASPCSGHGFKFASVIGEILADLAAGQQPAFDLGRFCFRR